MLAEALAIAVAAGTESVDRGPELLEVLREKGVVDAGGYGLVVLIAGALAALKGEQSSDLPHRRPAGERPQHEPADETYSHCVNFTVQGAGLDPKAEADRLNAAGIGDSVLVVGDSELIRVHVHTDNPVQARELFEHLGSIEGFVEEDMNEQIRLRDERLGGEAVTELLVVGHDAAAADLFELEGFGFVALGSDSESHSRELAQAASAAQGDGLVIVSTSEASLTAVGRALASGSVSAEIVSADHLASALLALCAVDGWDPADPAAVNAQRLAKALSGLASAAVRYGDRSAGDPSDVVVLRGNDAWTAETLEGAISFAAASFGPESFVTAVVDPSFEGGAAAVEAAFDEVEVSTASLGGWVCVFAAEA
jgi:dihydroxyacetone kinase-like predicted kinase